MDFLTELIKRFFGKSPVFFKIITNVSIVTAFITILPSTLISIGLDLPDVWDTWILKAVAIASVVSSVISKLTLTEDDKDKLNVPKK
mgnify:CR=1 FL=1